VVEDVPTGAGELVKLFRLYLGRRQSEPERLIGHVSTPRRLRTSSIYVTLAYSDVVFTLSSSPLKEEVFS
jgi:hypothetical protein